MPSSSRPGAQVCVCVCVYEGSFRHPLTLPHLEKWQTQSEKETKSTSRLFASLMQKMLLCGY